MMMEADFMTDYQFKSVLKMARTIVKSAESKEDAVEELDKIIAGSENKESSEE